MTRLEGRERQLAAERQRRHRAREEVQGSVESQVEAERVAFAERVEREAQLRAMLACHHKRRARREGRVISFGEILRRPAEQLRASLALCAACGPTTTAIVSAARTSLLTSYLLVTTYYNLLLASCFLLLLATYYLLLTTRTLFTRW